MEKDQTLAVSMSTTLVVAKKDGTIPRQSLLAVAAASTENKVHVIWKVLL